MIRKWASPTLLKRRLCNAVRSAAINARSLAVSAKSSPNRDERKIPRHYRLLCLQTTPLMVLFFRAPMYKCGEKKQQQSVNPLMGTLKPDSNGALYSNTAIGTLAVDGCAVTFGTARRGLGGLGPRPVPSSLYQM